jgi:hypothetical protein
MVFRVSGQDLIGIVKSLDGVEISGAILTRHTVRHSGEQHAAVRKRSRDTGSRLGILIEETGKGSFRPEKNVEIAGLG